MFWMKEDSKIEIMRYLLIGMHCGGMEQTVVIFKREREACLFLKKCYRW